MALKFNLKTKDGIPAELVNLYVGRDGACDSSSEDESNAGGGAS